MTSYNDVFSAGPGPIAGLTDLEREFPQYQIWQEVVCDRTRYVACSRRIGTGPRTLVTADSRSYARTYQPEPARPARHPSATSGTLLRLDLAAALGGGGDRAGDDRDPAHRRMIVACLRPGPGRTVAGAGGLSGAEAGTEGSARPAVLQGRAVADVPVFARPAVAGAADRTSYGGNVTAFERDHRGWRLSAGPGGFGYTARRRVRGGSTPVTGRTLDELAARLAELGQSGGRGSR
jgi:hypothetical protein